VANGLRANGIRLSGEDGGRLVAVCPTRLVGNELQRVRYRLVARAHPLRAIGWTLPPYPATTSNRLIGSHPPSVMIADSPANIIGQCIDGGRSADFRHSGQIPICNARYGKEWVALRNRHRGSGR
jgi:hypothetical protein